MATKEKTADELVLEMLKTVERKKKEILSLKKRPTWKTNCSLGHDPESSHDRSNIQTVKDPRRLVQLYAMLMQIEERYAMAAQELGLPEDLTYMAYPIVDWKDDLKTRATQLSVEVKQKEMDDLDRRVNKLVSPDQRREMELTAIQEILAGKG